MEEEFICHTFVSGEDFGSTVWPPTRWRSGNFWSLLTEVKCLWAEHRATVVLWVCEQLCSNLTPRVNLHTKDFKIALLHWRSTCMSDKLSVSGWRRRRDGEEPWTASWDTRRTQMMNWEVKAGGLEGQGHSLQESEANLGYRGLLPPTWATGGSCLFLKAHIFLTSKLNFTPYFISNPRIIFPQHYDKN